MFLPSYIKGGGVFLAFAVQAEKFTLASVWVVVRAILSQSTVAYPSLAIFCRAALQVRRECCRHGDKSPEGCVVLAVIRPILSRSQEEEYLQQLLERRARERYIQKERNELQKQLKVREHQKIPNRPIADGPRLYTGSPTWRTEPIEPPSNDQRHGSSVTQYCSILWLGPTKDRELRTYAGGH